MMPMHDAMSRGRASIVAAALAAAALLPTTAASAEPRAAPTVTRDAKGRVSRIEGPGYSVSREARAQRADPATPDAAPATDARRGLRTLGEPVVCRAGERLELRDLEIVVAGAGVIARSGCELVISGVEVRSGGWALVVERGARVRVDASILEGSTGSLDAAPGASVSAWSTIFLGPPGRPLRAPDFVDRGGNAWD